MKKLLLLSTLIAILPFTANAGNRIGPVQDESNNPVIATYGGPYQTAEITTADQTQVVSASYVKGAYNDTIAAINKLNNTVREKQDALVTYGDTPQMMQQSVYGKNQTIPMLAYVEEHDLDQAQWDNYDQMLISTSGVVAGIKSQRVTAVDTWGSTHTVDLGLKTVTQ